MSADVGKREAHKIATRRAIQSAADALFEHHGYVQTTIRDIADAAGVTERTFFRYFAGKEALLVKDIEAGIPILADEIRRRPAAEPPLDAVENALLVTADRLREAQPNLSWLFQDGPPGPKLAKSSPGLLFQLEQAVAEALVEMHRKFDVDLNWILLGVEAVRMKHDIAALEGFEVKLDRYLTEQKIRVKSEKRGAIVARWYQSHVEGREVPIDQVHTWIELVRE